MHPRLLVLGLVSLALLCAAGARAQATLPKDIFAPPAGATVSEAPAESIEFAGVTTVGKSTDLVFFDKATKKSRTVTLGGEPVEGLQVLRYDADKQQAVVKINGVQKTLPLRKATGPANAPAPVAVQATGFNVPAPLPAAAPAPVTLGNAASSPALTTAPAPATAPAQPTGPATPETIAKQEQEARMLVSDLLEIGMAQRKAYEDAQRKAQEAAGNSNSATATPLTNANAQPVPTAPVATPPAK